MKKNTFYIICGIIALIEVAIFWWSFNTTSSILIEVAFILGIAAIYLARQNVTDVIEDERTTMITQKAALRTFEIFWVVFFAISLGQVVIGYGKLPGLPQQFSPMIPPQPRMDQLGMLQLALLCLLIFAYVGFRMYYAHKYGDMDEEQD
jgi:uncharacterized membrane protein